MVTLPRVVVAAPGSGHGKTTIATGLMAALRRAGHRVSGHKVGPDYIDPGYHALATGRPGRNLDPQLVGVDRLAALLLHGACRPAPADIAVIEGVMGLFDGTIGGDGFASTAHVAATLRAPVLLVVDISHASRTIAALVHGLIGFDPSIRVAGVVLNKAGSTRHCHEVARALEATGVPVVGTIGRDDHIEAPSRHLGLVPVAERTGASAALDRLADQVAQRVDLELVMRIAGQAPPLDVAAWDARGEVTYAARSAPVVALAGGRAFTFTYTETRELLEAAGVRVATFDPLVDERLPERTSAIYLGGGFPQTQATALAANTPLQQHIRAAVAAGMPVAAECAGMLYLARSLQGAPMAGIIDADSAMSGRLTLSYRQAIAPHETLLLPAGSRTVGHEFHRTKTEPASSPRPAWLLDGHPEGFSLDPAESGRATVHASYLHLHWAGAPIIADRFARAADHFAQQDAPWHRGVDEEARRPKSAATQTATSPRRGLLHHGDVEATPGMLDLAVNVHGDSWPDWLTEGLHAAMRDATRYPDVSAARDAIAAQHRRTPAQVLPTSGAAEAFTLLARMRRWRHPVVVHPQFTEPEAALVAAGHRVTRIVLPGPTFDFDPRNIPHDADLVIIGNPTNPTGRLYDARSLRALTRPGRIVAVDEAFMDYLPAEGGSLARGPLEGLAVIRSMTKIWALPGLRAGYVLADRDVVDELGEQQPTWSVSVPAAAAMVLCSSSRALAEQRRRAEQSVVERDRLATGLSNLGIPVVPGGHGPFVLAHPGDGVRDALRHKRIAVRRCDTFPGLDGGWIRIAVRDAPSTERFLSALSTLPHRPWQARQERASQVG